MDILVVTSLIISIIALLVSLIQYYFYRKPILTTYLTNEQRIKSVYCPNPIHFVLENLGDSTAKDVSVSLNYKFFKKNTNELLQKFNFPEHVDYLNGKESIQIPLHISETHSDRNLFESKKFGNTNLELSKIPISFKLNIKISYKIDSAFSFLWFKPFTYELNDEYEAEWASNKEIPLNVNVENYPVIRSYSKRNNKYVLKN
ncbi:Uncharacterised protein [uncultured archaeon]|nr:Uncharacterised protein [uncultured archaeon]